MSGILRRQKNIGVGKQALKRVVAMLISISLITGLVFQGGVISFADFNSESFEGRDTELDNTDVGLESSGNINQTWKWAQDYDKAPGNKTILGVGGKSFRFDLAGRKAGQNDTYVGIQSSTNVAIQEKNNMKFTYDFFGFPTYLFMATDKGDFPTPPLEQLTATTNAQLYKTENQVQIGAYTYYSAKHGQLKSDGSALTDANVNQAIANKDVYNGYVEKLKFGNPNDSIDIEMRVTTTPSSDGQYMIVDYYLAHVGGDIPTEGLSMWMGSAYDLQINTYGAYEQLEKDMYKTDRGFYMRSTLYPEIVIDVITKDESLKTTDVSTKWVGEYTERIIGMLEQQNGVDEVHGEDNSIAYSWQFKLRPYETIHKRIAFAMKEGVYYVNQIYGDDNSTEADSGTFSNPFRTIEKAIQKSSGKNAYIYIQGDYEIDETINFSKVEDEDTSITIASSDMAIDGTVTAGELITLKRGNEAGAMFSNTSSAPRFSLTFADIIIDGESNQTQVGPVLSVNRGKLALNSAVTIQNNNGRAVEILGNADFSINGGDQEVLIKNNLTQMNEKGAIYFNSTGTFSAENKATILENKNTAEESANVYLPEGKYIIVEKDLGNSRIGVTTEQIPIVSMGTITDPREEVIVAKPSGAYPGGPNFSSSPFEFNFVADQGTDNGTGISVNSGTSNVTDASYTVFRRSGYSIDFIYRNSSTGAAITVPAGDIQPTLSYASGASVSINPPVAISGYEFKGTIIDPSGNTLNVTETAGANFGAVTGNMPDFDVTVIYEYTKLSSTIEFELNGGFPEEEIWSGNTGEQIKGKSWPIANKYGYLFKGWSLENNQSTTNFEEMPTHYPDSPLIYYAIFEPNPDFKFGYTEIHRNLSETIDFQVIGTGYSVEDEITAQTRTIPGYVWSQVDSLTDPERYKYDGQIEQAVGTFHANGQFEGTMPGHNTKVIFAYEPSTKFDFTVHHKTENGTTVRASESSQHYPESSIAANPVSVYGYELASAVVTMGTEADADSFIYAVRGSFNSNWVYSGLMPNQQVEITYIYEVTDEGYTFATNYLDNDTRDNNLRNIINPIRQKKLADAEISANFQNFYGYRYSSKMANPDTAGTFDTGNHFTGVMPNEDVAITYQYDRDMDKWVTLTYQSSINGSISADSEASDDLIYRGQNVYEADVLKNDGSSQGQINSHTWQQINERALVPTAKADKYYRFVGWFVDYDNNGGGEKLTDDYRFTTDKTVTAVFEEDPEWWIDIYFAAGANGKINDGENNRLHITKDLIWNDITSRLPAYTPESNYLPAGWYDIDQEVKNSDALQDGKTYTIRFMRDPSVFGTKVQTPDAEGRVDMDGSGKITVFRTGGDYKYIIANLDYKILDVQNGSDLSDRLTFTSLSPGSRYLIYEAYADVQVSIGGNVNNVAETRISKPNNVLVPVIEKNYYVTPDVNNNGTVKFIINPADAATDYALIDAKGNVVITSQTNKDGWQTPKGNDPATVEYSGLDYEGEYIVVGRPKNKSGILPKSRIDDGTLVVMDPGVELEIPTYIVETINGKVVQVGDDNVNSNYVDGIEEGEMIRLSANATNGQGGKFLYWRVIIGGVNGFSGKIKSRELKFEMPDTNLVVCAYYEYSDEYVNLEEEVRGGNDNEMALNPDDIPDLRAELTTDADKVLMGENGADVTYRVVFTKNRARAVEETRIKASAHYPKAHERAFKAAWGLNITIERYVDGRKVEMATPSNAEFQVITQLDGVDVDMMDYQLYQIEADNTVSLVTLDVDPEETGGLFRFNAQAESRYVLVYSRAHYVTFMNEVIAREWIEEMFPEFPQAYHYYFKVRRYGAVEEEYYKEPYEQLDTPEEGHTLVDNDGVQHWYADWSTKNMPESFKYFEPSTEITQKTPVYAYYTNNWVLVRDARDELEALLKEAKEVSKDYFLTISETEELMEAINCGQKIFDRVDRKSTYEELQFAIELLKNALDKAKNIVEDRNDKYNNNKGTNGGGGTGSGGGSGGGTVSSPYSSPRNNSYLVGTNGNWVLVDGEKHQWAFVLNGGLRLRSMWTYLEYTDGEESKTGWYHFNKHGLMDNGWFRDEYMNWYYCDTVHDGWFGKMKTGWHYDKEDGRWYYLDTVNGNITIGWREVEGKWYYFTTANSENTYRFNEITEQWEYFNPNQKPLGSLYISEQTPDGYFVDENGAWIE